MSHFLSSDAPPQALLLLPMTITPPHQLTNLLLHFLTTVTPSTPPYTSHITITHLRQLSYVSNTFHTSLRTVTLPVICHTILVAILHPLLCSQLSHFTDSFHPSQISLTLSSQPSYYMYMFHTYLTNSQLSNQSHISPSYFHTFQTLIIPTPSQLPKHIPHDSHLSNNCYIFMTTFTPS